MGHKPHLEVLGGLREEGSGADISTAPTGKARDPRSPEASGWQEPLPSGIENGSTHSLRRGSSGAERKVEVRGSGQEERRGGSRLQSSVQLGKGSQVNGFAFGWED